jgi:cytochrome c556
MTSKLLVLAVAVACAAGVARAAAPPADLDIIATRQAGQALVGGTFIGLSQAAKNQIPDVKPFAPAARALTEWEGEFVKMFPPGSEHGHNTKALPPVWTDRATFEKDAQNLTQQAARLQQIAQSGDRAAFAQQVQVLGDACATCHKRFRAR